MPGQRDDFPGQSKGMSANSEEWAVITPHDSAPLARLPRFIANGTDTGGTVRMIDSEGNSVVQYLAPGQPFPARPHIVHTDTTVTVLIAYY